MPILKKEQQSKFREKSPNFWAFLFTEKDFLNCLVVVIRYGERIKL